MKSWMIYGAYGYSGKLIVEESLKKGLRPILAGRDSSRLRALAEKTGLEWKAFTLEDERTIRKNVSGVHVVLNAAGPFASTALPLARACLYEGVNYTDITGEILVFRRIFELHEQATKKGVLLLPGTGFDVVPTDCLAKRACEALGEKCMSLEIAFLGLTRVSRGTARTMFSSLDRAFLIRKNGKLIPIRPGEGTRKIPFPQGEATCMPIAWGDLETAFRSTDTPDITTYMAVSSTFPLLLKIFFPAVKFVLSLKFLRSFIEKKFISRISGPDEARRKKGKAFITVIAEGKTKTHIIMGETPEPYYYTAISAVKCIEKILNGNHPKGALTPSLAFGSSLFEETGGKVVKSENKSGPLA